jgi:glutathione synthase/RimK-type ligase-like ATP-grasp enzyme
MGRSPRPLRSWDTGAPMETTTLATCAAWPALSASDQCLAAALRARGRNVVSAPWNGPFEPFARGPVVIRSTWDYHETPDAYVAWLDRLPSGRTFNPPPLIRWNVTKTHVLDLAERGAPAPRSRVAAAEPGAVAAAMTALGLRDAVIKPLIGASGFGVERVARGDETGALARAMARKPMAQVLVQEFLASIADGELAGVFFDGVFSHALRRVPAAGEFRINSQYGGRMEAVTLTPDIIDAMTAVLALLPKRPLYARVDGVVHAGRFMLMEVEVNEPGLGLDLVAGAAERFADAIIARL